MIYQHSSLQELLSWTAQYRSDQRIEVTFSALVRRAAYSSFRTYTMRLGAQKTTDELRVLVTAPTWRSRRGTLRERLWYRPVEVSTSGQVAAVQTFYRALGKYEERRRAH